MAKKKETPKRPSRERLDEWAKLEAERLRVQREAKDIRAKQQAIEEEAFAYAEANADATRVVVCHGYRLKLEEKRASVKWKDEFVRVASHEEAETIIASQETWEELEIVPPEKK
jgi:hypothetical protein